ncbi:MAG TPA: hypothetical protein VFO79_12305 [Xanthomonadales bacterium]|nr:hypothetical protein [Xanthomonadales bacterium]
MDAQLTFLHIGLLFVVFAAGAAVVATISLARFLSLLEERHGHAFRTLGSPRFADMAPGAGPRLFRYLRDHEYRALNDAATAAHARRAWLLGWSVLGDLLVAIACIALFVLGVALPGNLSAPF